MLYILAALPITELALEMALKLPLGSFGSILAFAPKFTMIQPAQVLACDFRKSGISCGMNS